MWYLAKGKPMKNFSRKATEIGALKSVPNATSQYVFCHHRLHSYSKKRVYSKIVMDCSILPIHALDPCQLIYLSSLKDSDDKITTTLIPKSSVAVILNHCL